MKKTHNFEIHSLENDQYTTEIIEKRRTEIIKQKDNKMA